MRPWLSSVVVSVTLAAGLRAEDRILRAELVLPAPVAEVWGAWTTEPGIRTFFAPAARVELRVDGRYDILFFPDNPEGERGAEGMRIVGLEPMRRFAFTWNAPPHLPRCAPSVPRWCWSSRRSGSGARASASPTWAGARAASGTRPTPTSSGHGGPSSSLD